MYIEIDNSIGDFLKNHTEEPFNKTSQEITSVLTQACLAMKQGLHCVKTQSEDCAKAISEYLKNTNALDFAMIFSSMYQNFSTYLPGLKSKLECYVSVGLYEKDIEKIDNTIKVNIAYSNNLIFWGKPCFLPENINDDLYFEKIAELRKDDLLKSISFTFIPEQGSGSRTIDTFTRRSKDHHFILAIVDSDQTYPNAPFRDDSIADKLKKNKSSFPHNAVYHILSIHEIENLFSSDTCLDLVNPAAASKIKAINSEIRQFYDFKKGLNYKKFEKNEYMQKFVTNKEIAPCSKHDTSEMCDGWKKCSVSVLPGFGDDFLKNLFSKDSLDFTTIYEELIDPIKQEWDKIYSLFLTYFCSYSCNPSGA